MTLPGGINQRAAKTIGDKYIVFERALESSRDELGGPTIGEGGKITETALYNLRHLIYQATLKISPDELPEGVLMRQGYTGREIGVQAGGGIGINLTPPRYAEYFLPRTYEWLQVSPSLGPEYIPNSGQFQGPERLRGGSIRQISGYKVFTVVPSEPIDAPRLGETLDFEDAEKIVAAYEETITSPDAKFVLSRLKKDIQALKERMVAQEKQAIKNHARELRSRLSNLIQARGQSEMHLPDVINLGRRYEEGKDPKDQDKVLFDTKVEILIYVPIRRIRIWRFTFRYPGSLNEATEATDREFVEIADRIADECIGDLRSWIMQSDEWPY